ncbi:glutamate-1-semialdehyde 2,1-aminomutase [Propionispira raffinosivorans]|uniref:glutamate-1-semialdehyde 2,1-aminomutase n=1 Tax=Propionispira raffinosivorans TaxID=86959 RepID=UPI0003606C9A|nr:glutamate-1-semialdehyde 2,1-aminomutase [Propionispira raffinosivorans]
MALNLAKSAEAFAEAKQYMPGGVNSPVRSYRSVDCDPPFIAKAKGSKIYDIDGNEYIDYVGSWGPMVIGHAHEAVVKALQKAVELGTSYGAPTLLETELAKRVQHIMPSIEMIRMVNSGTEATMSALRLARGFTGREKIVKFIGCYHGHHDSLLVKAGSGMATFGVPDSPGVPKSVAENTITVPYNDVEAIRKVMAESGKEIAAIIVEPVAGNMGLVLPKQGYLKELRVLTEEAGALLIFDEVMCGFRASLGGAQAAYGIVPDLTCLGKIIGGGLPVAAYGGRKDIMLQISPAGPVYQAGTLSGNPLAMTAGIETLKIMTAIPEDGQPDYSRVLTIKTKKLLLGLQAEAKKAGLKLQFHQAGSMFGIFFNENPVYDYETAAASDAEAFKVYFKSMLEQGIYLAPSPFETAFMSGAHSDADIEKTIQAAAIAFAKVAAMTK